MSSEKLRILSDKEFGNLFWKLSSSNTTERERSSLQLIQLINAKKDCSTTIQKVANGSTNNEDLTECAATSVDRLHYSLERLFKGLAGSKPEAKLGFSLAITMLLERLHKHQVRSAFDVAQKCLLAMQVETKHEGSSKRVGLCFLLLALTRAGAFRKLRTGQKSALLDQVVPLLEDKALLDLASVAVASAVDQLSPEEFAPCLFTKLSPRLSCGWESLDVNGLLLLLCCQRHHKDVLGRSFLKTHYGAKHLISEAHFDHFQRICLSSSEGRETLSSARLHPGIEQLLDCLLAKSGALLAQFVAATVAATAVADPSVPASRKAVAFNLLGWVADCPAEKFAAAANDEAEAESGKAACLSECLSSPEVCRQLRLHASSQSSVLHGFARHLLGDQLLKTGASAACLATVAGRLLGADCLFDCGLPPECRVLRGPEAIARLPIDMADDCARRIERTLAADDVAAMDAKRIGHAVQTLRQLTASRALLTGRPKSSARILLCLADRFLASKQPDAGASAVAVAAASRAAFSRALETMSAFSALPAYRRCLRLLAKGLAQRLASASCGESSSSGRCLERGLELLATDADGEAEASSAKAGGGSGGLDWCFALAYLHLGFHLLPGSGNADESAADADALIDDLDECRRRSLEAGGEADDGRPQWPDVLLDSFLGLLAASSAASRNGSRLMRSIAGLVAKQVASLVTPEGVSALSQVLLEENDGEEGRDGDGSGSGSEEDSDDAGDNADGGDESDDAESEISIESAASESSDEDATSAPVDPAFRRACKAALGPAACPSDVEDADPSDLSDSAMERVDEALSLAFRSNLGPRGNRSRHGGGGSAASRAAALERRRRQCQARLRALDLAEALLAGVGPDCRAALAACLGRLALLAAGAVPAAPTDGSGGGGGFWSAAPAAEREQLRQRAVGLLRRASTTEAATVSADAGAEIGRTVDAALAANLRAPLPVKVAETATEAVSALLRVCPAAVESRLADALSGQLEQRQQHRLRIGGLALWQRVCAERPRLLRRVRGRLLELLLAPAAAEDGLRSFDLAAVASLAVCLIQGDVKVGETSDDLAEFYRRLADWTFERLGAEAASVTSARLLVALLSLAAALLRLGQKRQPGVKVSPALSAELADRLRSLRAGCRNADLRRGLHACLTAMAEAGAAKAAPQAEKRQASTTAGPEKRRDRKRRKIADGQEAKNVDNDDDEHMNTD